jgi:RNA polymerase sigma factor (sigma-70 family)
MHATATVIGVPFGGFPNWWRIADKSAQASRGGVRPNDGLTSVDRHSPESDDAASRLHPNDDRRANEREHHPVLRHSGGMGDRRQRDAPKGSTVGHEQFAIVYERLFDDVYAYLCRRVGRSDGEDLAAQTFALALRDADRFDPERGTARAWVFGIAANVLRGHRRSEVRRLRALARTGVDSVLADTDETVARVDAGRATRSLAAALAALSAGDREVLLLAAWADLTSEEIGQALGIPGGTARSRLNRSRRKLRAALGDAGHVSSATAQEALDG